MMKQRIQKVLSAAGIDSRRHVEEMVLQGRVAVNGKVVMRLPILIDPAHDRVTIDGEKIRLRRGDDEPLIYVLLHKPKNVYVTNVAQGEQKRAIDLLPVDFPRLYPVGRLDHDARGVLLFTNDGDLTHRLTHARFGVPKTYRAAVEGTVTPQTIELLKKGVWLADPKTGRGFKSIASHVRVIERGERQTIIEITVKESRNPELRRMMAKLGHRVRDLQRIKFGPLSTEGLAPGKWRLLTPGEITRLRAATEHIGESSRGSHRPKHQRR